MNFTKLPENIRSKIKENLYYKKPLEEKQIDLMVCKLYDFTYEEVKIVDAEFDKVLSEFGLYKEDYERMSLEKLDKL